MMVDLQNQFEEERIVWEEERKQLIKEAQELQKELLGTNFMHDQYNLISLNLYLCIFVTEIHPILISYENALFSLCFTSYV